MKRRYPCYRYTEAISGGVEWTKNTLKPCHLQQKIKIYYFACLCSIWAISKGLMIKNFTLLNQQFR